MTPTESLVLAEIRSHKEGIAPHRIREMLYRHDPFALDEAMIMLLRRGVIRAADRGRLYAPEHAYGKRLRCRICRGSGRDVTGAVARACEHCDGKGVI